MELYGKNLLVLLFLLGGVWETLVAVSKLFEVDETVLSDNARTFLFGAALLISALVTIFTQPRKELSKGRAALWLAVVILLPIIACVFLNSKTPLYFGQLLIALFFLFHGFLESATDFLSKHE